MGLPENERGSTPQPMTGAGADARAKNLKLGSEALTTFKKRVDTALRELEKPGVNPTAVADQEVTRTAFSGTNGPFVEADLLFTRYVGLHTALTRLSHTLGEQIEAMGIAVLGAEIGFEQLEDDVRRRFWAIQQRTETMQKHGDTAGGTPGQDAGKPNAHEQGGY